jgi:type IV pilus assembly protein PilB
MADAPPGHEGPRRPLGQRLVNAGLISPQQLEFALKEQARTGQLLGEILVGLNFTTEAAIAAVVTRQSGEVFDDLAEIAVPPEVVGLLPVEMIRERKVFPVWADAGSIRVAMVDTFDVETIDEVARITGREVDVVGCPKKAFFAALHRHLDTESEAGLRLETSIQAPARDLLGESGEEVPIATLVDQIIAKGVVSGATDVHVEPEANVVRIRYRIDGILQLGETIPKTLQSALESRFKVTAKLDISEKRMPQDGRIQMVVDDRQIDLRVSTLPAIHGENIVLRLLDREKVVVKLDDLGFAAEHRQMFAEALDRPNGIVLVTGPTGSGKTTTLYAGLMEIDSLQKNVMTLEDPVEYRIPVIRQAQVNPKAGFTFASGLRALLRQDPDVILVGEMRDRETADLAIRAAMTGHLVLSTLHTNDAASALPRLLEIGIPPYLLPSTIIAVISQRLVRKPCPECRQSYTPDAAEFAAFGRDPEAGEWVRAVGCERCNHTGYKGRIPIAEFLCMSPAVGELILAQGSSGAIHQAALAEGMTDLRQDGYRKARHGLTTLDEVRRVAERRQMLRPMAARDPVPEPAAAPTPVPERPG